MLITLSEASLATSIAPPPWVAELVNPSAEHVVNNALVTLTDRYSRTIRLVTATVADADQMGDGVFEARVAAAYAAIFAQLHKSDLAYPVRLWNFLPKLQRRERYEAFNAGRHRACENLYGGQSNFPKTVATASAVGHRGRDLVIHCLARSAPGVPVNNPAQVRPYQYSKRYGELPPCFARGTLIDDATLLVGGTASIVGEDSLHVGDLAAQTQQTLDNLSSLVMASGLAVERPLDTFTSLRVYHPRSSDREMLAELLGDSFPAVEQIEFERAELCRAELLVEIEGTCGKAIE